MHILLPNRLGYFHLLALFQEVFKFFVFAVRRFGIIKIKNLRRCCTSSLIVLRFQFLDFGEFELQFVFFCFVFVEGLRKLRIRRRDKEGFGRRRSSDSLVHLDRGRWLGHAEASRLSDVCKGATSARDLGGQGLSFELLLGGPVELLQLCIGRLIFDSLSNVCDDRTDLDALLELGKPLP